MKIIKVFGLIAFIMLICAACNNFSPPEKHEKTTVSDTAKTTKDVIESGMKLV